MELVNNQHTYKNYRYKTLMFSAKVYTEVDVTLHPFLTAALDGGELLAQCSGRFTPKELSTLIRRSQMAPEPE